MTVGTASLRSRRLAPFGLFWSEQILASMRLGAMPTADEGREAGECRAAHQLRAAEARFTPFGPPASLPVTTLAPPACCWSTHLSTSAASLPPPAP